MKIPMEITPPGDALFPHSLEVYPTSRGVTAGRLQVEIPMLDMGSLTACTKKRKKLDSVLV